MNLLQSALRLSSFALTAAFVALSMGLPTAQAEPSLGLNRGSSEAEGRVLVVGFDGADWRKTQELMAAGQLPNMAKLMDAGTAGPLVSTNPAESAAGWAAINTGANPARNGVASFFKRDFFGENADPIPALGHIKQETVKRESASSGGSVGLVDRLGDGPSNVLLGVGVFFLVTIVLRLVLKTHALLSLVLGLALGTAAAYGTQ
ncbi:MAG: hypothetical protein ACJA0P_001342, partial [Planctomycetota bacterium]